MRYEIHREKGEGKERGVEKEERKKDGGPGRGSEATEKKGARTRMERMGKRKLTCMDDPTSHNAVSSTAIAPTTILPPPLLPLRLFCVLCRRNVVEHCTASEKKRETDEDSDEGGKRA